jgi:hypothetical protein
MKEKETTNNTTQKQDADERELIRTTLLPRKQALIYLQRRVGELFSELAAGAKYFEGGETAYLADLAHISPHQIFVMQPEPWGR